jgi:hypothetical protein
MKFRAMRPMPASPKMVSGRGRILANNSNHIKYQSVSQMAGSKVLKKKLVNGRITYQDVVLTEENVKLHEQKYQ